MRKFIRRVQQKWLYSVIGLWTAIREEKSLWAYFVVFPIVIGLGIWLKIDTTKWAIIILTIFTILAVEVLNTALEAAVDTISFQYNIKVKKIKDIAAGATLLITTGSFIVVLIIFIPEIQAIF